LLKEKTEEESILIRLKATLYLGKIRGKKSTEEKKKRGRVGLALLTFGVSDAIRGEGEGFSFFIAFVKL